MCTRRFRSAKWLRAHMMSDHGKAGIDRLKEMEQQMNLSKSTASPTLKIPNGNFPGMLNNVFGTDADPLKQFPGLNPGLMAEMDDSNNNNNNNHSSGGKIKEYQCSFCAFSTPYYAFLFIHERSHSLMHPNVNNAILRNVSPMIPNALASGLLTEFGQFKEDFRSVAAQQPFISQSESAVSIAKDIFPMHSGQPVAASITPSSTPASTPGIGSGMAETNNRSSSNDVELVQAGDSDDEEREQQPPRKKSRSQRNEMVSGIRGDFMRKFSITGDAIPMGRLSKLESSHMLRDMANLTKRPAIYALPKESEPMIMQSFLIEESRTRCGDKQKLNDVEDAENRNRQLPEEALALVMANNNSSNTNLNGDLKKSAENSPEDFDGKNRFVPAVVFLPVRERISAPVTISFTLTPA